MELREATLEDLDALVDLQRAASLAAFEHIFPPDRYPFPEAGTVAHWRRTLTSRDEHVLVAAEDGAIVGVVAFTDHTYVHSLLVAPDRWGSGIGGVLTDEALRRLQEMGHRRAWLWVMEPNERARRFYEACGWRPDGRTERSAFPPYPTLLGYTIGLETFAGPAPP
jgi:RimJ/RimL family protein N-acetyltransferase